MDLIALRQRIDELNRYDREGLDEAFDTLFRELRPYLIYTGTTYRLKNEHDELDSRAWLSGITAGEEYQPMSDEMLRAQYTALYGPFVAGEYKIGEQITARLTRGEVIWSYHDEQRGLIYVVDDGEGWPTECPASTVIVK